MTGPKRESRPAKAALPNQSSSKTPSDTTTSVLSQRRYVAAWLRRRHHLRLTVALIVSEACGLEARP